MLTPFLTSGVPRGGPAPNPGSVPGVIANGRSKRAKRNSKSKSKPKGKATPAQLRALAKAHRAQGNHKAASKLESRAKSGGGKSGRKNKKNKKPYCSKEVIQARKQCRQRKATPAQLMALAKAHRAQGNPKVANKLEARAGKRNHNPDYPSYYSNPEGETNLVAGTPQVLPAKPSTEAIPALLAVAIAALLPRMAGLLITDKGRRGIYAKMKGENKGERVRKSQAALSVGSFLITWLGTSWIPSLIDPMTGQRKLGGFADIVEKYRTFILAGHFGMTTRDVLDATVSIKKSDETSKKLRYLLALTPPDSHVAASLFDHIQTDAKGDPVDLPKDFKNTLWGPELSKKPEASTSQTTANKTTSGVGDVGDVGCNTCLVGDGEWQIFTEDELQQMQLPSAPAPQRQDYMAPRGTISTGRLQLSL